MSYSNPYISARPLPPQSQPIGPSDLNNYLNKYYQGGAADPLGMNQPPANGIPNYGGIATATLGGLSLIGDTFGIANQSLGIEQNAPGLERSATGEPIYNTGQFYNAASAARPQGTSADEAVNQTIKGASAGMALGPAGAAVGGVLGLASSLIGGGARKNRQRRERTRAVASARTAQGTFNTASQAFDQQEVAQSDYLRRMNNTNRLYHLYS